MSNVDPRLAFKNTDPGYLARCLAQRQPESDGAGSRFLGYKTLYELFHADWQPYAHPAVQTPAIAFKAQIPGHVGLIAIADLDGATELTLDDRKGTGKLEVLHRADLGPEVAYTTLLVGPDRQDPNKLVVWTFFPGDPISPSQLPVSDSYRHGSKITAAQALKLGFVYAKVE